MARSIREIAENIADCVISGGIEREAVMQAAIQAISDERNIAGGSTTLVTYLQQLESAATKSGVRLLDAYFEAGL
jgi:hypothetical protein